jgi:hypothetical protein
MGLFGPAPPRTSSSPDEWLRARLQCRSQPSEDLPYTPAFNQICDDFSALFPYKLEQLKKKYGESQWKHAVWRFIVDLRKRGLLGLKDNEGRTKRRPCAWALSLPLPLVQRADELIAYYATRRDHLPYTDTFDCRYELLKTVAEECGVTLLPADAWRLLCRRGKGIRIHSTQPGLFDG